MIPGTAIISPKAVVIKASDMPSANKSVFADPLISMLLNTLIMPTTVPKSPNKGLMLAIVLNIDKFRSKRILISEAFSSAFTSTNSLGYDLY